MILSKTSLLLEKAKRINAKLNTPKIELIGEFSQQNNFIEDPSKFLAACTTRRAGKTSGLAIRFIRTMERHPGSQSLYVSLTQDAARDIMLPAMTEMDAKYKIGLEFTPSNLLIKHPNGAKLKLMGATISNFTKRLRGRKFAGVAIDEAQDFGNVLEPLIDDVLTPSIADYTDGWMAVTGTPGAIPKGIFFDITQNNKYGYTTHKWSLYDNPYMPNPKAFVDDLKRRKGWSDDNPTLLREYFGQWVLDKDSLWIKYDETKNNFNDLPKDQEFYYIFGIDLGYKDADAIAVLAWSESSPKTYLVEEIIQTKQGITELVAQISKLQEKYKPIKTVIDEGGLGKKIAEEIRRRHGISIDAADKARKQEYVELMNDALMNGNLMAKKDSKFASDSYRIQIDWEKSTPNRIAIKKDHHSDIIDAVLYAWRESYAFAYSEPELPVVPGSKKWLENQEEEMFQATLDQMLLDEQAKDEYGDWE